MNCRKSFFTLIALLISSLTFAQLGETFDIERPEKYAEKQIGYEKTYTKKFGLPRRFIQNTISHYNFFFNANEKLKDIILKAKEIQKDSFDRLLNYYSFSLAETKNNKTDLDSVIQKASGGILLHDLRTNWVDNFYLLIGKAYLLRNDFDSAEMTFNYINYEYAPKTKDKDRILAGSRDNDLNGNNVYSISTKEKKNIKTKLFERPPSRNEAFLWMIRSNIENEDFGSASGLIQTLRNDPVFPKRLYNDLDELTGYLYYKLQIYDSAAHYVVKSLSLHEGKNDKARREFLAAQLYELGNNAPLSSAYYAKSVQHTLDPIMEVYARLYSIKLNKSEDPKVIENNIAALLKMGRKDAYTDYRDIIYYFAAQMELERKQTDKAKTYLLKSTSYAGNNISQKNKSFLALADISYLEKNYRDASNYYDSVGLGDPGLKDVATIVSRKEVLKQLVGFIETVETEDSLQTIAKMPEGERDDYLKKLLRRLRKESGLKEEASFGNTSGGTSFPDQTKPVNLFEPNNGEWYFYNNSMKSRGYTEFKKKWGNRSNIDGWRLSANFNGGANTPVRNNNQSAPLSGNTKKTVSELTIDALLANLPLTDSAVRFSNDTIQSSLFAIAKLYHYELEDVKLAIETYETLLKRFPKFSKAEELYYNLYLCYLKAGDTQKAASLKKLMETQFANGKYTAEILQPGKASGNPNSAATAAYTTIYNLFLEGKFEEALTLKKQADTKFGNNNWTQQLLYIEAVYYIKNRQDSLALNSLTNLVNLNATSPLGLKATTLSEVLKRRSSIEAELQQLNITRATEDTTIMRDAPVVNTPPVAPAKPVITPATPTVITPVAVTPTPAKPKDTLKTVTAPKPSKYIYKADSLAKQYVGVVLTKVDNIFINEARNSFVIFNRSSGRSLNVDPAVLDTDTRILLIGNFSNANDALGYLKNVQAKAATEIVPWLAKDKYSFILISDENMQLLWKDKNVEDYKNFLKETFPGKFQ